MPWPHRSRTPARSPTHARRRESLPVPLYDSVSISIRLSSNHIQTPYRAGRLGASVKGTESLTGVLEATVRDPSRSGPGTRLINRLTKPKLTSASAGDPTPFSRLRGVTRRETGGSSQVRVGVVVGGASVTPGRNAGPRLARP